MSSSVLKTCLNAYFSVNIFCVGRVMTLFSSEPSSKSLTILICRVAINLSTRRHAAILSTTTTEARSPEDNQHHTSFWNIEVGKSLRCQIKAPWESILANDPWAPVSGKCQLSQCIDKISGIFFGHDLLLDKRKKSLCLSVIFLNSDYRV